MPAPFKQVTREQFAQLLASYKFTRKINAVHMHHTWRPNHSQYRGHDTIVSMWEYHTKHNGWSDIAQHITIAPDGSIWLGRNWNQSPASASGHNGSSQAGPFMFEMIGDFDVGKDPFGGEQRRTAVEVIARVQMQFDLPPGTLRFHNMMSPKSCPGSAIDYDDIVRDVILLREQLSGGARDAARYASPFSADTFASDPLVRGAMHDLARPGSDVHEPYDASPCEYHLSRHQEQFFEQQAQARSINWTPAQRQELLPHIVNLRSGQFSHTGDWSSTAEDVDAIFDTYLPRALAAAPAGKPLPLVLYAHGGLTDEESGLEKARLHIQWWKQNGAYPIYFVWETGFCETLQQILEGHRQQIAGTRNLFSDKISDPILEGLARKLGGEKIWGAMKHSARQASSANVLGAPDAEGAVPGGAYYLARRLAQFCVEHPDRLTLHAVGHSAGSVFHSHFVPQALNLGVQAFRSMHLMAPAVRTDVFKQQLLPLVGSGLGVDDLTVYTMLDSYERDDNCGAIYRKSLLYLIHHALEPESETPILGLERSIRQDPGLKKLFGIGSDAGAASVVWSRSSEHDGCNASRSTTHGGFDDDASTMESIARRVLGLCGQDGLDPYPGQDASRAAALWWQQSDAQPFTSYAPAQLEGPRRALCVGINDYPTAPLGGCVNDARMWSGQLKKLGFQCEELMDQQATRANIIDRLERLVVNSQRGDVIVFQFAGHGTQVDDLDGDEANGDTPGLDEAICPVDFASGELLIDDDLGRIFSRLPEGVNLTCFFDCCHSGTVTRMGVGRVAPSGGGGRTRARFIVLPPQVATRYALKRRAGASRALAPSRGLEAMREVVFSACLSSEVALESNGHGEFTLRAMKAFETGVAGLSNEQLADRITANFGSNPSQHAKLYSAPDARGLGLLEPLVAVVAPTAGQGAGHSRHRVGSLV